MKILYVTTVSMTMGFFPPHIRMLQEAGHTVELACNMDEPLKDTVLALGCKAYHIPFSRSPLSRQNIAAYRELRRIIEEGHYDIVHTHTPVASALVRFACRKLRRTGLRIFYTAHGFHFYTGAPLKNWLIYYPVELLCSRWTDVQLTITKEDFERASRKLHAKKTVYIPGVGVDLEAFHPSGDWKPSDRRAELGIPQDGKLLLSVGELNENKNHAVVLEALSQIRNSSIYYVICGEGDRRPALQQLARELGIADRVFLLGVRRDVPEWMAEADIYVHPSLREGLSVSTMEAMASGLPVVCGDIRGNRDLIEDGKGGKLVDPRDAAQFTAALAALLEDTSLCKAMGNYNKEKVAAFSLERVLVGLGDIFRPREIEK